MAYSWPRQIGGAVLGDVWRPEERGKAIAIYSLAPLLGPVLGLVCGAWIAEKGDWRWVVSTVVLERYIRRGLSRTKFWAPTIVSVASQLVGLWFLQESEFHDALFLYASSSNNPFKPSLLSFLRERLSTYAKLLMRRKAVTMRSEPPLTARTEGRRHLFNISPIAL